MPKIVELRPRKELLNIKFEKYQFSSEDVPVTEEINLVKNVIHREPSPGQDSLLEARLFAFHNHLFQSPYDDSCWFFDEDDGLWSLQSNNTLQHVHSLPKPLTRFYNSTIAFASEDMSVLSNGGATLHILIKNSDQQKVIPVDIVDSGIVMAARHIVRNNSLIIIASSIIEENNKKRSKIILLNYSLKNQGNLVDNLELSRRQEMMVNGAVDYVYIESSGDFIDVLSRDSVRFTYDSMRPVGDGAVLSESQLKIPKYYWSQDADSLTVWVKIPERYKDARAEVKVNAKSLAVTVEDSVLMQGECQFKIEEGSATWSKDKDTFKLEVMKAEAGQMWSELIKGDTGGEHLPNEALAAEIHSRLSHLCTDQSNAASAQPAIGFNAEQLEECDLEGDHSYLQRINLQEHLTTHLAMLGTNNRLLFTQNHRLCIRHDHDGCVWSLLEGPEDWTVQHESTFPGFGYVEASKSNKKFCTSPLNGHYVAIIEHTRHAFIYEKPGLNDKVARQKIVDLGPDALPIMGAITTDQYLILLTQNKLNKLKVN